MGASVRGLDGPDSQAACSGRNDLQQPVQRGDRAMTGGPKEGLVAELRGDDAVQGQGKEKKRISGLLKKCVKGFLSVQKG